MTSFSVDLLDDDCWGLIFERLMDNNYDFASVSLACKRFLFITNRMKVSLLVSSLTVPLLPRLFQRFRNLKSLEFRINSRGEREGVITRILESELQHLEVIKFHKAWSFTIFPGKGLRELGIEFKGLKRLDLSGSYYLCDEKLFVLKDFFPGLEELRITAWLDLPVTDEGIEALTLKLNALKKIAIIGCSKITDKSLMSLSSNCVDLTDVSVNYCKRVTENGIGFLMRHSPHLTSLFLRLQKGSFWQRESEFTFENSIAYANNLEDLKLCCLAVSNEVVDAIAKASPPLKCLHLNSGIESTHVLAMLLSACPSLIDFSTEGNILTDAAILEISKHLGGVTRIDLSYCYSLGSATFFMLTKNCPFLESIDMGRTCVGKYEDMNGDLHQNYRLKNLDLSGCSSLNDRELVRIGLVCPNLELLDISHCGKITDVGVAEFLNVCPKLEHLVVTCLAVTNFLGQSKEDNNFSLISIVATFSQINDEVLGVIGGRCPNLEEFDLKGCQNITGHGVNELLRTCEKLKKIHLKGCHNVNIDLLELNMNSKRSLQVTVPPPRFDTTPTRELKNLFWHNGSILIRGWMNNLNNS